ncbi:MAG TPA: alpha/beta fold hydrolase [Thermoanaerobaculia bacterium]|nr:alpha/beta fold hydrolase [Thermoanaerobaculia bacterium]
MSQTLSQELQAVEQGPVVQGVATLRFHTDGGTFDGRFHEASEGQAAVVWLGGAAGALEGPASGLYTRLAERLAADRIASLRLDCRDPSDVDACALDTLTGVVYLESLGRSRVALVGHSFGGAVAIAAGVETADVVAVAALSSQTAGTGAISYLSPRPLLLVHGMEDEVQPDASSRDLYIRAKQPKDLLLYPGCRHDLDECRDDVDRDLMAWLRAVLA